MRRIDYTSVLSADYRAELEALLFFNPEQHRFRDKIRTVIETHGVPVIHAEKDRLNVRLKNGSEVQTLYALAGSKARSQLVGVVVYTRSNPATITVLHIAVSEDYSSQGRHHKQMMVPLFIGKLREIGRQIKGVTMLRLLYDTDKFREIPV
ncbi:MAG: hypothetical protein ABL967_20660 [Bryobacteraceae bacterium]